MNYVNLGSIVVVNSIEKTHYINKQMIKKTLIEFEGLSTDFSKLQDASLTNDFTGLATGSTCFLYDTKKVYKYNASNKTWYEL